ncbi:hypothetical protein DERP_004354, partial [Dermatophagoides pteronyssinus]
IIILLLSSSS